MKNFKKGFTLIELLVVIAIIGVLASIIVVSLGSSQEKAKVVATKKSLGSIRPAISLCCDSTANSLQTIQGGNVCSPAITGSLLPTRAQLKLPTTGSVTYVVKDPCSTNNPAYYVRITGHTKSACNYVTGNNATAWVVSETAVTPPTNC